jgi:hypothetical protein
MFPSKFTRFSSRHIEIWLNSRTFKVLVRKSKGIWHQNPCESINPVTGNSQISEISSGGFKRQDMELGRIISSHYLPSKQRLLNSALFQFFYFYLAKKTHRTHRHLSFLMFSSGDASKEEKKRKEILQKWIHMWNICLFDYLNDKGGLRADQMEVRNSIQVNLRTVFGSRWSETSIGRKVK